MNFLRFLGSYAHQFAPCAGQQRVAVLHNAGTRELSAAYHMDEASATSRNVQRIAEKVRERLEMPRHETPVILWPSLSSPRQSSVMNRVVGKVVGLNLELFTLALTLSAAVHHLQLFVADRSRETSRAAD